MKAKVAKEFHWEMGHRLQNHKGLCRNIHGHSYRMRVEIEGDINPDGMVLDYYDINECVKPLIIALDHAFICDNNDELMLDFLKSNDLKCVIINCPTTAENILLYITEQIKLQLKQYQNISKLTVRLHETESVHAEIEVMLS